MKTLFFTALLCIAALPGLPQPNEYEQTETEGDDYIAPDSSDASPLLQNPKTQKLMQAKAHYVLIEYPSARMALLDLQEGITWPELMEKYPHAQNYEHLTVARFAYTGSQGQTVEFFSPDGAPGANSMLFHQDEPEGNLPLPGPWIFEYRPRTRGVKEALRAFYFTSGFSPLQLPRACQQAAQGTIALADSTAMQLQLQIAALQNQLNATKSLGVNAVNLTEETAKKLLAQKKRMLMWQTALQLVPVNQLLLNWLTRK